MSTDSTGSSVWVPAFARLLWVRITFSRVTIIYFAFSIIHCAIQVGFQSRAFQINEKAASYLQSIINEAGDVAPGFAVVSDGLRICENVPNDIKGENCDLIWMQADNIAAWPQNTSSTAAGAATNLIDEVPSSTTVAPVLSSAASPPAATDAANVVAVPAAITSPIVALLPAPTSPVITTVTVVAPTSVVTPNRNFRQPNDDSDDGEESDDAEESDDDDLESLSGSELGDDSDIEDQTPRRIVLRPFVPNTVGKRSWQFKQIAASANENGRVTVQLGNNVTLDQSCVLSLTWPTQKLENTKREDIAFISFQFWVLGMSVVALLNESMPHIIASLLTHVLATAWGGFQLAHTDDFRRSFTGWITNGACGGVNLLPNYWAQRKNAEVPSEALNVLALLVSLFLSFRLIKLYGWQTFKRVGASRAINRIYKIVLCLSISIQLSIFFMVVSMALWIDQLYNGAVGRLATEGTLYKALYIITFVLLIPWLTLGWFSSRREWRKRMVIFLLMSFVFVVGFGAMFVSPTFRWTWLEWTFFSIMTTAAGILACLTFILGVICRMNFGKGLPRYLMSQESLEDTVNGYPGSDQKEYDPEKVQFPTGQAVPAYAVSFEYAAPELPHDQGQVSPPAEVHVAPTSHYRAPSQRSAASTSTHDPFQEPPSSPIQRSPRLGRQNSVFSQVSSSSRRTESSGYSTTGSLNRGPPTVTNTISSWVAGAPTPHGVHHERQFSSSSTSSNSRYEGRSRRWVIE